MKMISLILIISLLLISGCNRYLSNSVLLGDSDGDTKNFHIYFNHSIYRDIHFNISKSPDDDIHLTTIPGEKYIFGEDFA